MIYVFFPTYTDKHTYIIYMFLVSFCCSSVCIFCNTDKIAVILEHFDQVVGDCFMDCVNCLIGFANNKTSHRISLKAIALLRICEDRLAEVSLLLFNISGNFTM